MTASSQGVKFLLRFGSTAVLARLLTPEDYGLVAMTAVVVGFAGLFKDAGLSTAVVQREQITHEQISALLWINVALGALIACVLAALAPAVAWFYGEPRLLNITWVMAIAFVFGGGTVQHQALLCRQMRFRSLAMIEIVSMMVGITVAFLMAFMGFGYWALVGMVLGTAAANAAAVWIALPWRPGAPRRGCGVRPFLRFGSDVLGFNVLNYFSRHADNLLIGWCWGAVPLGFYDKAYNLLLLPVSQLNAPITAVMVPALSRARVDLQAYRKLFLGAFEVVTSVSVPVIVSICLFADEIVSVWLGTQWSESVVLFRLLSVASLFGALTNPIGWILISLGFTKRLRQLGLFTAPIIVLAFLIGVTHGPKGVATAYSIAMLALFVPSSMFALHGSGVSIGDLLRNLIAPLMATLTAVGVVACIWWAGSGSTPLVMLASGLAFAGVYAFILLVAFGRWARFRSLIAELRAASAKPAAV